MNKIVGKCVLCGNPLTGVRRGKMYCSDAHRMRYKRINPNKRTQEQGASRTNDNAKKVILCPVHAADIALCAGILHADTNYCFAHEIEPEWCTNQKGEHIYGVK